MFCVCHEVYMKHLINKVVFFLLMVSSFSYMSSILFLFPFYVFVVSKFPFLCCDFFYQIEVTIVIFYYFFSFNLYAVTV